DGDRADGHRAAGEDLTRLEGRVTAPAQQRETVVEAVRGDQVEVSVAIEIGERESGGESARLDSRRRREIAATDADEDDEGIAAALGDGDVEQSVAVEIAD